MNWMKPELPELPPVGTEVYIVSGMFTAGIFKAKISEWKTRKGGSRYCFCNGTPYICLEEDEVLLTEDQACQAVKVLMEKYRRNIDTRERNLRFFESVFEKYALEDAMPILEQWVKTGKQKL